MPTPRINKGAFGGPGLSNAAGEGAKAAVLGAEQDLKEGQAQNIAREERDYIKSERKRIADERVYQREEDFYVAADIADAGLGYEAGLEDVFRKDKTKFAAIAAKGANATSEERAQLRQFKENINKVSGGQKALKKILGDYRTAIDTDGAISASTPPEIAQLLKDLDMGKGDFRPITGPNGEIRLQGTDSAGNKVDYSYDQLQSLKFSPKYDLNTSIIDDVKLIGNKISEVSNAFGGSATYKNTPGLITAKATDIAETRLKSVHALYEVGAELGYTSAQRKKIIDEQGEDAFRQLVTKDYTQRLIDSVDSSITTDGSQNAAAYAAALSASGKGSNQNIVAGDYQVFGKQIKAGDTSVIDTSLQTLYGNPTIHSSIEGSNFIVRGTVGNLIDAKTQLGQGKTLKALDGTIITAANISKYSEEDIAGASYEVKRYDVNNPEGNRALFNDFEQGRGYTATQLGGILPNIQGIDGGLGIIKPELTGKEAINQAIVKELSSGTPLTTADSNKFYAMSNSSESKSKSSSYAQAFTKLTGKVPEFLAGPDGAIADEFKISGFSSDEQGHTKLQNVIKKKLEFLNSQLGTDYSMEDLLDLKSSATPGYTKRTNKNTKGYKAYQ